MVAKEPEAVREFFGFDDARWPDQEVEFDLGGRTLRAIGAPGHHAAGVVFYDPATGYYGFSTRFVGLKPHHTMVSFSSVKDALNWCDGSRERIWEEASDADETKLLISRDYKEGTVGWRMAHLTLAELSALR